MEENNKPNYVLKFNDSTLQKVEDKNSKMKKAVVIIIAIIVIGSIIFGENLFLELSWTARILLICLAVGFLFSGKREDVPNPAELQFYDDYLILYCPKKCYSKKNCRKEIFKMNYKDITNCKFLKNTYSKRFQIYGNGQATWYNYDKDGNLSNQPDRDRFVEGGMIYFTTFLEPNIDFIKEIEEHSPIKVTVVENY